LEQILKGPHLLADDLRMKERLGFDGHPFRDRACISTRKPSRLAYRNCVRRADS
jgi:hypothetical protein